MSAHIAESYSGKERQEDGPLSETGASEPPLAGIPSCFYGTRIMVSDIGTRGYLFLILLYSHTWMKAETYG